VEVPGENTRNEWCEPVTDEEYARLKYTFWQQEAQARWGLRFTAL